MVTVAVILSVAILLVLAYGKGRQDEMRCYSQYIKTIHSYEKIAKDYNACVCSYEQIVKDLKACTSDYKNALALLQADRDRWKKAFEDVVFVKDVDSWEHGSKKTNHPEDDPDFRV